MLTQSIQAYVVMRRAAGFGFKSAGSLLKNFAAFSEARGELHIRAPIAIEWAALAKSAHTRARRLGVVIRCS